jgi:hypothetical protein
MSYMSDWMDHPESSSPPLAAIPGAACTPQRLSSLEVDDDQALAIRREDKIIGA